MAKYSEWEDNMKITLIVGARPQFVKVSPIFSALKFSHNVRILHTGQHYDDNMSRIFFEELDIPMPDINLNIGSSGHGGQTGAILEGVEKVLLADRPDAVIVFGDTNSTLAGALATSKLLIPLAHVEAGLRSFDKGMPEEQNRVCTDHLSDMLFCPTQSALDWLAAESITRYVYNVGDVMYDAVLRFGERSEKRYRQDGLKSLQGLFGNDILQMDRWYLATVHRAENTQDSHNLSVILSTLNGLDHPVVFPAHPRIHAMVQRLQETNNYRNILFCEPVGYLLMNWLSRRAVKILTDSGGLQKEAYMMGIPCVTLSNTTSWVETLEGNWNVLTPEISADQILQNLQTSPDKNVRNPAKHFGQGNAAEKIAECIQHIHFIRDRRRE